MNLKPLFDKVVLTQKKQEEKTASGIILPGGDKEMPMQGTIVAVVQVAWLMVKKLKWK